MATLYLVRHGQTYNNRRGIFTGQSDSRLTPKGRQQAAKVAKSLKNIPIGLAYQSSLKRSHTTLQILLKPQPTHPKVLTDSRLNERSYGQLERHYHSHIITQYGTKQFRQWHRDFDLHPPGGESFAEVEVRIRQFLSDLRQVYASQKINILISAHGNSIRLLRRVLEHASKKTTCRWNIKYDRFYRYHLR